jgi:hypothetical protein
MTASPMTGSAQSVARLPVRHEHQQSSQKLPVRPDRDVFLLMILPLFDLCLSVVVAFAPG